MITKAILKTQEDERYEIGGELHDNVCQILVATQLSLGMLKKVITPEKMNCYDQSRKYISAALEEIRNLSHRLAPAFFDDTTLEEAFQRLFCMPGAGEKFKIQLYFDKSINQHPVNRDIQLNLYRILQEQLTNIRKHADATAVEIQVLMQQGKLRMKITDDGRGFDVEKRKSGIGLANMKRRAELFSGKFTIESMPGKGCTVTADIPCSRKQALIDGIGWGRVYCCRCLPGVYSLNVKKQRSDYFTRKKNLIFLTDYPGTIQPVDQFLTLRTV